MTLPSVLPDAAPEGKAAVDSRGHMHVTARPGLALCGAETVAYPLDWQTRAFMPCTACIRAAVEATPAGDQTGTA